MAERVYFESYSNVYRFMDTVGSRPNNGQFGESSGKTGSWSGTETWEEAVNQFQNGIPETAEKLKRSLDAFKAKSNICTTKSRPVNYYYGYTPNIPAAIMGMPKSMKRIERTPQKVKAVTIAYDMCQNGSTRAETLQRSGETVLQLVYALECRGYRVSLNGIAFASYSENRKFVLSVILKEWKQHLDIMKLSFPLTSPAMFRRFAFKWAETLPDVTKSVWGYGSNMAKDDVKRICGANGIDVKNTYLVTVEDCTGANYDAIQLAKNLGIII
jgi:hypothetical protein